MTAKFRIPALLLAAALTVTALGLSAFASIRERESVDVNDVDFVDYITRTMNVDEVQDLEVEVDPYDAESYLGWESSDPEVLRVDGNGQVTALKPGRATITVKANANRTTVRDSITITVRDPQGSYVAAETTSSSTVTTAATGSDASRNTVVDAVRNADGKTAILKGYSTVAVDTLQAAAKAGSSKVAFDTRDARGRLIGRLTITPASAQALTGGTIKLGVHFNDSKTRQVQDDFDSKHSNKIYVLRCDQGNFGMAVNVKFRAGEGTNADKLNFYYYNSTTDSRTAFTPKNVRVDSNGYVGFDSTRGGYIIVSVGELK